MDDSWDSEHHTFLSWDDAHIKFKLTVVENEDWITLTSKIIDKRKHLLEDSMEVTCLGQSVSFYYDGMDNPTFML